ncbi:uncharacterized protein HaLaN_15187, partial [Haematococcus lacustris]
YPYYSPSASYRQLDLVAGSHQYTISGFSLARALGCGTRLCSDLFEVAGQAFRLEVYPAGCTADTRSYVSAFLTTPGSLNPNHVLYEVAVIDQSGRDKHVVASRGAEAGRCRPLLSQCRGIVAALPKLVKARLLEDKARRYLPDDMLVLRATVQVVRGWSSPPALHTHLAAQAQGPAPHLMQQPGYGPAAMGWAAGQPALPSNVLELAVATHQLELARAELHETELARATADEYGQRLERSSGPSRASVLKASKLQSSLEFLEAENQALQADVQAKEVELRRVQQQAEQQGGQLEQAALRAEAEVQELRRQVASLVEQQRQQEEVVQQQEEVVQQQALELQTIQ